MVRNKTYNSTKNQTFHNWVWKEPGCKKIVRPPKEPYWEAAWLSSHNLFHSSALPARAGLFDFNPRLRSYSPSQGIDNPVIWSTLGETQREFAGDELELQLTQAGRENGKPSETWELLSFVDSSYPTYIYTDLYHRVLFFLCYNLFIGWFSQRPLYNTFLFWMWQHAWHYTHKIQMPHRMSHGQPLTILLYKVSMEVMQKQMLPPGSVKKTNPAVSFNLCVQCTAYYATNSGIAENHFILMVKHCRRLSYRGAGIQFSKTKHTWVHSGLPGQSRGTPPTASALEYCEHDPSHLISLTKKQQKPHCLSGQ